MRDQQIDWISTVMLIQNDQCWSSYSSAAKIEDSILKILQLVNSLLFFPLYVLLCFLNKNQAIFL